ncbi:MULTISPECIES: hypothetical protein [Streptomyces]|uniref:hypothetical protein n=1 Tax=Streptomyces TaxID=1883 RepID=UPI000314A864|nr:hypothetical protein [Streptomyces venezuelae]
MHAKAVRIGAWNALLQAVIAAQHWHRTRDHTQQAEAARQAAEYLRVAYRAAAA